MLTVLGRSHRTTRSAIPEATGSSSPSMSQGWTSSATAVRATLDVLELSNGRIPVPPNLTRTVIEIGCNGHNLAWDSPFGIRGVEGIKQHLPIAKQTHVLLVSFEPLLDKYTQYLSIQSGQLYAEEMLDKPDNRGRKELWSRVERPRPAGWSVPGRAIVLPFAVGMPEGTADFHVAQSDGCSSLLPMDANKHLDFRTPQKKWMVGFMQRFCGRSAAVRRVPVVSLGTILERWLPKRQIDYVRVDAQGYDLRVVLSAPPEALARVGAFELEITSSDLRTPYAGADLCPEVVGNMSRLGFRLIRKKDGTPLENVCQAKGLHSSVVFFRDPSKMSGGEDH